MICLLGRIFMDDMGVVFKRCGCRNPVNGRRLDRSCPRLDEPDHGSWYFACSAPNVFGRAERMRRGGDPSRAAAHHAPGARLTQTHQTRTRPARTVAPGAPDLLSRPGSLPPPTPV